MTFEIRLTVTRSMDISGVVADSEEDARALVENAFDRGNLSENDLHYEMEYDGVMEMEEYYEIENVEKEDEEADEE